jgi:UDP-N-acetylglucosamine:LPS N-acetylglucosamine transferase
MIHSKELSGKTLSSLIMNLEKDRGKLQQMENQAKTLSRPKAAETIVDECYRLVAQTGGENALRSEEQV